MADNVTAELVVSAGETFATDDDGTAQHPYTKVEWGPDNTFNKVDAASGKALPVQGEAAENAATTGNPVLTGGRYDATPRTLGDGDVGAIALDADGAVQIADGGNSITIDGTVTADLGATDNALLTSIDAAVNGTLTVGSHAVTNAGTFVVQEDGAALTALQLIDDVVFTDDTSTHAEGTTKGVGIMAAATPTDTEVGANDIGMVGMSLDRRLHVDADIVAQSAGNLTVDLGTTDNNVLDAIAADTASLVAGQLADSHNVTVDNASGASAVNIQDGGNSITVDNAGTFAVQAAQATASSLNAQVVGNVASAATDSGNPVKVGAIFNTTQPTVTTGQRVNLQATNRGSLKIGPGVDFTNYATNTLQTSGNSSLSSILTAVQIMDDWDSAASDACSVAGDVAHDTADAGEPAKIGAKAVTSVNDQTVVGDDDRTNLYSGEDGVLITRPHCHLADIVSGNASNTDGSSTQVIAAQAAGVKTYLTSIILTNTSSTDVYCEIKDGTTVKLTIPVPANGGAIFNPPVPLGGTAATAWNFDMSAATTTAYCSMMGFKSKV